MLVKLIYLVRSELTLTRLKSCSLSRGIGLLDCVRIMEFGSMGRVVGLQHLVVGSSDPKVKVSCHSRRSGQIQFY